MTYELSDNERDGATFDGKTRYADIVDDTQVMALTDAMNFVESNLERISGMSFINNNGSQREVSGMKLKYLADLYRNEFGNFGNPAMEGNSYSFAPLNSDKGLHVYFKSLK